MHTASLVHITPDAEELISYMARVSNPANQSNMVSNGVAKECARDVLPMASPSKLYMNGTIRSWLHYCDLRTSNGTQREHSLIANGVRDLLYTYLPIVSTAMWTRNLS
jgi:thymidylate synthase ThyX